MRCFRVAVELGRRRQLASTHAVLRSMANELSLQVPLVVLVERFVFSSNNFYGLFCMCLFWLFFTLSLMYGTVFNGGNFTSNCMLA